jgi:hypothetical protein
MMSISVRNWTLNEKHGAYSGSRISETEVDLHLGFRRLDGSKENVGRFHLPLLSLHKGGFVARRDTDEGNWAFTVKIFRDADSNYSIGTEHKRTPFASYAAPPR